MPCQENETMKSILKSSCKAIVQIVVNIVVFPILLLLGTGVMHSLKNSLDSHSSWDRSIPAYTVIWLGIALVIQRWDGTAVPLTTTIAAKCLIRYTVLGSLTYLWIELIFR